MCKESSVFVGGSIEEFLAGINMQDFAAAEDQEEWLKRHGYELLECRVCSV